MTENGAIELHNPDLVELADLGNMLISSGFFKDSTKVAQAAVKVLAGRELGLGPVESMRAFHIVEGKVEMSADLLAQRVKASEKYDYTIQAITDDGCSITFWQEGDEIGTSNFTIDDAKRAGLIRPGGAWEKYPRNMLFARAMSNGVGWFCPDVAGGARIYVEGEISGLEGQPTEDGVTLGMGGSTIEVAVGPALADPVVVVDTDTGEINPTPDDGTGIRDEGPQMLTDGQRRHLFALVNHLGYDEVERKARAGVDSFNDLTAARASELIDEWTALVEARAETTGGEGDARGDAYGEGATPPVASEPPVDLVGEMGVASEPPISSTAATRERQMVRDATEPDDGKPPNQAQWDIALSHFESRPKILQAAALYLGRAVGMSTITSDELTQLTLAKLKGEV